VTKQPTKIEGAYLLGPQVHQDERGFFLESWNRDTFRQLGIKADFVQDNHSRSSRGVLRGLHYQAGVAAQGKLVTVTAGAVYDVVVDLRRSSPTYGKWDGHHLRAEEHTLLWVPPGCAHGFLVMTESADFQYKCSQPYNSSAERTLRWDDPTLAIAWPLETNHSPLVSHKDALGSLFSQCEKYE
jgi:dTDP-4-dehydrorhamnose 3,5-epimerase